MRHALRGNRGCRQPTQHIFIDTESYRRELTEDPALRLDELRCWYGWRSRVHKGKPAGSAVSWGAHAASWWKWLDSQLDARRGTWVWGHNIGYDFRTLLGPMEIEQGRLVPKIACLDAGRFILSGTYNGKRVTFLDSLNWLPCPLADLATWTGRVKEPLPDDAAPWVDWLLHCRADVYILRDAILRLLDWHRQHDMGVLRATAAGQSLQLWRHRLGPHVPDELLTDRQRAACKKDRQHIVYPLIHQSEPALNIERAGYYGPTTAVYRVGRVEGPIYALDVQSCYPSLLRDHAYPVQLVSRVERPSVRRLAKLLAEYGSVACVLLRCCEYEFPVKTDRWKGRATGTAWTVLPGPELRHCLELDAIEAIEVCYLYKEKSIFDDYVAELAELRAHAQRHKEPIWEMLAKRIANALYGKFGQTAGEWELTGKQDAGWLWGERYRSREGEAGFERLRSLGGHIQLNTRGGNAKHAFPAIPAYVTSYARLEMDRLQRIAGIGHYYHAYSDSLHCDSEGYRNLLVADEVCQGKPGKLRLQAVYDWCHYFAAGRYEASDGRHCAGLSRTHWIGEDGTLRHWHYTSMGEALTARLVAGRPLPGVVVREETYSLNQSSGHRLIGADGWTYPHVLQLDG